MHNENLIKGVLTVQAFQTVYFFLHPVTYIAHTCRVINLKI